MGGQDGCERRIEVFVKIQKKIFFFLGGGGGSGWGRVGLGSQGRCERRIEVFVKIQKKIFFFFWGGGGLGLGGGGGVRVDVNQELKFLRKIQKKKMGGGVQGGVEGVGLGGQDGCERRIEVFVKIQKKNFFLVGGGGRGGDGSG